MRMGYAPRHITGRHNVELNKEGRLVRQRPQLALNIHSHNSEYIPPAYIPSTNFDRKSTKRKPNIFRRGMAFIIRVFNKGDK